MTKKIYVFREKNELKNKNVEKILSLKSHLSNLR